MTSFIRLATLSACLAFPFATAEARTTTYDGAWSLVFVTERGACDPQYSFNVNINNGIVTHPNIIHFHGVVGANGSVRASVTVHEKRATGSGKLSGNTGRGAWSGSSGSSRCSGYWTAQKG
jgi:acyl dehydratase